MSNHGFRLSPFEKEHGRAVMAVIELVLVFSLLIKYLSVQAKLKAICNRNLIDCYEYPKYLRDVLKQVYKEDYKSIMDQIKSELGDLAEEKDVINFLKIMEV